MAEDGSTRWPGSSASKARPISARWAACSRSHAARFGRQGVRLEQPQGHQRRDESRRDRAGRSLPPKRLRAKLLGRPPPTGQPHPAPFAEETQLAQLVVPEVGPETGAKTLPQPAQALARALAGRVVADPHRGRVTRVIPVGHDEVQRTGLVQEGLEEGGFAAGDCATEDKAAVQPEQVPDQRIAQVAVS